jgi:hypothetical protein
MTQQFLSCLMQLKLGTQDDQDYIVEIQRIWCLLLDKVERKPKKKFSIIINEHDHEIFFSFSSSLH